jgi:hypothetical protein
MDTRYAFLPATATELGANLYRQIDGMHMSEIDRERAKNGLRTAETLIEATASALRTLRGWLSHLRAGSARPQPH